MEIEDALLELDFIQELCITDLITLQLTIKLLFTNGRGELQN
jgi:hypothetical protein